MIKSESFLSETKQRVLDELKKDCDNCYKCELGSTRKNIVFSDGSIDSKIMLIGEAPGANEDETGIPFVGRAGKLLDVFLQEAKIPRETSVYIANTVKCRPPENRVPTNEEKAQCRVYLEAQIQILKPKVILLCGATSMKSFLNIKQGISKVRGEIFEGPYGAKMMPIFHPSYLLRNHSLEEGTPRWLMKQDLEKVKTLLSE